MRFEIILISGIAWGVICVVLSIFLYRYLLKKETIIAKIMKLIDRAVMIEINKQRRKEKGYKDFEEVLNNYIIGSAKLKLLEKKPVKEQIKEKKPIKEQIKEKKPKKEKKKVIRKEIDY